MPLRRSCWCKKVPCPNRLGHLETTSSFWWTGRSHMVGILLYLYLFAWGHSVATRAFRSRKCREYPTPVRDKRWLQPVFLRVPVAHIRDLISAPWSGFPPFPLWLSHSLTILSGITSQIHHLLPNLCPRVGFWRTPKPRHRR